MDALVRYGLEQVDLRLKRELTRIRSKQINENKNENFEFFQSKIDQLILKSQSECKEASLSWLQSKWNLKASETWILCLGIYYYLEPKAQEYFSEIVGPNKSIYPSLGLAQILWDDPLDLMEFYDPSHRLKTSGLIQIQNPEVYGFYHLPAIVARSLMGTTDTYPFGLKWHQEPKQIDPFMNQLALQTWARLQNEWENDHYPWIKLQTKRNERTLDAALQISSSLGRSLMEFSGDESHLPGLLTWSWLNGTSLLLTQRPQIKFPLVPVLTFCPAFDDKFDDEWKLDIPEGHQEQRLIWLKEALQDRDKISESTLVQCSHMYRFGPRTIKRIGRTMRELADHEIFDTDLLEICQKEVHRHFGGCASQIQSRVNLNDLILPSKVMNQFNDLVTLVQNRRLMPVSKNEKGLSVLFSGSPGTGKTLAAQVLGTQLNLPVFRVDLSLVVSKYIGETEKNISSVFDAAEEADCLLFFDEADALFGRRTEVKDSHDRYANLEISYLLQRTETFQGIVVLATNRRKDLDEAFLRRISFALEFPTPEYVERLKIWEKELSYYSYQGMIDLKELAKKFPLSGGYISSAVKNAMTLAYDPQEDEVFLEQLDLLIAIHRELEKLGHSPSSEQFGEFSQQMIQRLGHQVPGVRR